MHPPFLIKLNISLVSGPYPEKVSADHLIVVHAAYSSAAAVNGSLTLISHNKKLTFGNGIGEIYITFAESFIGNIRFVKKLSVKIYISIFVNIYIVTWKSYDAFEQKLVLP